jgi:Fe-coproporphyrin III synthase
MGPTGEDYRVVQLHPTRRCNLRCRHCYSRSGPDTREQLPIAIVETLLRDAGAERYNLASFSGGEPTMYPELAEALACAHANGLSTTVTSNGMLLSERLLERLRHHLDLLAISLDGVAASHNAMRASANAFEVMERRLDGVRRSGQRFGFIFTLTQHNLHELEWVAAFAAAQGAGLLQIHPLEETGRAADVMAGSSPDAVEASVAFLEVSRLQQRYAGTMQVHLDLLDRRAIAVQPACMLSGPAADHRDEPLAEIVSPLIVEPDGTVVPMHYGFDRRHAFGSLYDRPLRDLIPSWREHKMPGFLDVCRRTYEDLLAPADLPFVNWYPLVAERA